MIETVNTTLVVALIGLIVVITVHIVVIARWSGKIDGYIQATAERLSSVDAEIRRLRDARHEADGKIARHEGLLREMRSLADRRVNTTMDDKD